MRRLVRRRFKVELSESFVGDADKVQLLKKIGFEFTGLRNNEIFYCENADTNRHVVDFPTIDEAKNFIDTYGAMIINLEDNTICLT